MQRVEKELVQLRIETEDLRTRMQLEQAIKQRGTDKLSKEDEAQIAELQQRLYLCPLSCALMGHAQNTEQTLNECAIA